MDEVSAVLSEHSILLLPAYSFMRLGESLDRLDRNFTPRARNCQSLTPDSYLLTPDSYL